VKFQRELDIKESRLHIVEGLVKAIEKMDAIIKKIRAASDKNEAKKSLMAAPFRFTDRQAEAILEMRLRQLTNLDQNELACESNELQARIAELNELSSDEQTGVTARKAYMLTELTELGKRHGEARRSSLVDPPVASISPSPSTRSRAPETASKPRFLKVDAKKGTVEQVKGPRGALVVDSREKVILMTEDGTLKKVPATFKGAISSSYSPVSLAKRESEVLTRKFLVIFTLDDQLKAMVLKGEDICKTTSKGKRWIPEGSKVLHFGENSYQVTWVSKRKKPVKIDLDVKEGKPGSRGIKIASLEDVVIG
jgi:DNA gyrase/topoisomerase IV subunit A